MDTSKKLLWTLWAGTLGALTAVVGAKALNKVWTAATGDVPPDPNDPDVPLRNALAWAVASGIGLGLTQLLVNRFAASQWERNMGTPPPGLGKTTLKL